MWKTAFKRFEVICSGMPDSYKFQYLRLINWCKVSVLSHCFLEILGRVYRELSSVLRRLSHGKYFTKSKKFTQKCTRSEKCGTSFYIIFDCWFQDSVLERRRGTGLCYRLRSSKFSSYFLISYDSKSGIIQKLFIQVVYKLFCTWYQIPFYLARVNQVTHCSLPKCDEQDCR